MMDWGLHAWAANAGPLQMLLASTAWLTGLYLLFIPLGFAIESLAIARNRKIYDVPIADGQLRWEAVGTLRFLAITCTMIAAALAVVASSPSTGLSFALTFVVCMFSFDVYYWCIHRAMHSRSLYRFHRYHHSSRVNTPLTSISTSATEALGWGIGFTAPVLLLSLVMPISLEAWAVYLAYNSLGNVAGHLNAEVAPAAATRKPMAFFNHPISYHALHHARVTKHYVFGTTALDMFAGTVWEDWQRVYARIESGRPLTKLEERA